MMEDKVKIRVSYGNYSVEFEGRKEDALAFIQEFIKIVRETGATPAPAVERPKEEIAKPRTCKQLILSLLREGWMDDGKKLGEVHEELVRRGYRFDRTAVAHALLDLVREGILAREGRPRNYVYYPKKPTSVLISELSSA